MKFKKWLNENTIYEYWGPYSRVDSDGTYYIISANELPSPLYLNKDADFTYINKWPLNKTLNPPWNKYFRYYKDYDNKNIVSYTENRAVDVICYNPRYKAVYLINRNTVPKGIALPGGFFDHQADAFDPNNPPDPKKIGPIAAARELKEETRVAIEPSSLSFVGTFLTGDSDTREKNFRVWAYSYNVPDDLISNFKYGDDASQAPGSDNLRKLGLKGWYDIKDLPNFAFPHHKQIIMKFMI